MSTILSIAMDRVDGVVGVGVATARTRRGMNRLLLHRIMLRRALVNSCPVSTNLINTTATIFRHRVTAIAR